MTLASIDADVVIVGAGPAGACAALSLLTYSQLKVVLVEQSDFSQVRVGEHVSDSLFSLLDYLKLAKTDFPEHCFMPCYADTAYWGSDLPQVRHAMFSSENSSVQLEREAFDFTLIAQVVARGGVVYPRTHCQVEPSVDSAAIRSSPQLVSPTASDKHWLLQCSHPEQPPFQIHARYFIDASGRNSRWGRQFGGRQHKLDQLMGAGRFFSFAGAGQPRQSQQQIIESCEHGWWYGALLPNQQYVATFFSDADIISDLRLNQHEHWLQLLQQTRHLKHHVAGSTALSANPWVRNASSQCSEVSDIANFIAIGDAACAFDPISSMGVGFAISSACHAARLVMADLAQANVSGQTPAAITPGKRQFQQDVQQHFAGYQSLRQHFYMAEPRWTEAPFWQRRQTADRGRTNNR